MTAIELDQAAPHRTTATLEVLKRDGRRRPFDDARIRAAVTKAFAEVHGDLTATHRRRVAEVVDQVDAEIAARFDATVKIYEIQGVVEHVLLESHEYDVARAYIDYRVQRDFARSRATDLNHSIVRLLDKDSTVVNENANKDSEV
ncbi:ATP cone domain-containing protein, partial [Cellulosimicrobium funkei]